jgi:hypothetical protein
LPHDAVRKHRIQLALSLRRDAGEFSRGVAPSYQAKIQRGPRKIRTGSHSDQPKAQLTKNLEPKLFQAKPFKVNPWLVAALPVPILSDHC